MFRGLWDRALGLLKPPSREENLRPYLDQARQNAPVPVFWLLGKTQSGKTTLIKYLTGAEDAEIGQGFQPCTRFSRRYEFPSSEAPLLSFLDTRGLDEPGYDARDDLAAFDSQAHLVLVVVRLLDHAQENLLAQLKVIRAARPGRPVLLVLTCTHEAYPQQQHPDPYPFATNASPVEGAPVPEAVARSLAEQRRRFEDLVDRVEVVDITPPGEGFAAPDYGGALLTQAIRDLLPAAEAQTFQNLAEVMAALPDAFVRRAMPTILAYSSLAASAGALPVPVVDLVLLSGLQSKMIYDIAKLYGQPLGAGRFLEVAGSMGLGLLMRGVARSAVKAIPYFGSVLGSVTGGIMGGASTYALGRAFCFYYQAVLRGHTPNTEDLKRYYREQLDIAQRRLSEQAAARENAQASPAVPSVPPQSPQGAGTAGSNA